MWHSIPASVANGNCRGPKNLRRGQTALSCRTAGSDPQASHVRGKPVDNGRVPLTIHCVTHDTEFAATLDELLSGSTLGAKLVVHPADQRRRQLLAPRSSGDSALLLLDADSLGEQAFELLDANNEIAALIIGAAGTEPLLCDAHNRSGCEFMLKDAEQRYLQLLPCVVRKLLLQRDQYETTSDMLRSSEKRYEDLIHAIPDIVYKIDPSGRFTFVNNAVRSLGYSPDELIGAHFSSLLHAEDVPRVSRSQVLPGIRGSITGPSNAPGLFDERRTGDRCTHGLEVRVRRKNGASAQNMIASVTAYGEIAAAGHYRTEIQQRFFTGTVGIIRDVTQRKRSQQMLHELSVAIEQSKTAVCIARADGRIDYANPFFLRLNRHRPEDVLGQNLLELLSEYLQEETAADVLEAIRSGTVWEGDSIVWRRDGESYWSWIKIYPVHAADGEVQSHILFVEDITDRKQSEAWLRQNLQDKERSLQELQQQMSGSLQLVAGLLAVQQEHTIEPQTLRGLNRCAMYVIALETAYEQALAGADWDRIDLRGYLSGIIPRLARRYGVDPVTLSVEFQFDSLDLALDRSIALGMITAEILGYALDEYDIRYLSISHQDQQAGNSLTIRHGGSDVFGSAAEQQSADSETDDNRSMLLRIVEFLALRIDGSFTHDEQDGARYSVEYREQ